MTLMDRKAFLNRGAAFAGAGLFSAGAVETLANRKRWRSPRAGPAIPTARFVRFATGPQDARSLRSHGASNT